MLLERHWERDVDKMLVLLLTAPGWRLRISAEREPLLAGSHLPRVALLLGVSHVSVRFLKNIHSFHMLIIII